MFEINGMEKRVKNVGHVTQTLLAPEEEEEFTCKLDDQYCSFYHSPLQLAIRAAFGKRVFAQWIFPT